MLERFLNNLKREIPRDRSRRGFLVATLLYAACGLGSMVHMSSQPGNEYYGTPTPRSAAAYGSPLPEASGTPTPIVSPTWDPAYSATYGKWTDGGRPIISTQTVSVGQAATATAIVQNYSLRHQPEPNQGNTTPTIMEHTEEEYGDEILTQTKYRFIIDGGDQAVIEQGTPPISIRRIPLSEIRGYPTPTVKVTSTLAPVPTSTFVPN